MWASTSQFHLESTFTIWFLTISPWCIHLDFNQFHHYWCYSDTCSYVFFVGNYVVEGTQGTRLRYPGRLLLIVWGTTHGATTPIFMISLSLSNWWGFRSPSDSEQHISAADAEKSSTIIHSVIFSVGFFGLFICVLVRGKMSTFMGVTLCTTLTSFFHVILDVWDVTFWSIIGPSRSMLVTNCEPSPQIQLWTDKSVTLTSKIDWYVCFHTNKHGWLLDCVRNEPMNECMYVTLWSMEALVHRALWLSIGTSCSNTIIQWHIQITMTTKTH